MKTVILKNLYQGENSVKMMIRNGEKIYQQLTKFVFDVDKDSIEFPASGDTDTITITASEPWTMTVPSWLTASAVSGRSSATITLTSQPTEETLEGDIVITCNGVQKTVSVTAGVHDYSKDYFTIEALESGDFIVRRSGVSYSVNGGEWQNTTGTTTITLALTSGDKVRFKGTAGGNGLFSGNTLAFNAYGNIESLEYGDDFIGQTSIRIGDKAFYAVFNNCSKLMSVNNLILPATVFQVGSYNSMFYGCTILTVAPELPAEILKNTSYANMFYGCASLNYIKCLATDISARSCTTNWVHGVAASGTFVKKAGVTWPTGNSGIPSGWTVIEE